MTADKDGIKSPYSGMFETSSCLTLDQLRAYAENKISEEKRFEVESHLVDCPLCSDALEGLKKSGDYEDVVRRVKEIEVRVHDISSTKKQNWKMYYSIAAVLVLAISSILFFRKSSHSSDLLFTEYFKPYPNMVPLVRGEELPGNLESAMIEYESENYSGALAIFKNILNNRPTNDTVNFYAGIASICLNDQKSAIDYLRKVASDTKSDLADRSNWYLGLAYMKDNNIEEAKSCFRVLAAKEGNYRIKSIDIMDRLK